MPGRYEVVFMRPGEKGNAIVKRLRVETKNEALEHVRGKREVYKVGRTWLVVGGL
jgi:hypothetical protein